MTNHKPSLKAKKAADKAFARLAQRVMRAASRAQVRRAHAASVARDARLAAALLDLIHAEFGV